MTAQAIDSFRGYANAGAFPSAQCHGRGHNGLKLFNHSRIPTRLVSVE